MNYLNKLSGTIFYCMLFAFIIMAFYKGFNGFTYNGISKMLYHSDFYINYQAGFVRRGLDGEIIFQISKIFDMNAMRVQKSYNMLFLMIFTILTTIFYFKAKAPLFLVFSFSIILLFVMYIGYGLRKDHIMVIYFLTLTAVCKIKSNKHYIILLINIVLIIGTLSHEIFFIISFFPVLYLINNKYYSSYKSLFNTITKIVPSITVFLIVVIFFKGNSQTQFIILKSWQSFNLFDIKFNNGIFDETIFITKLNLTINQYIGLLVSIFSHCIFIILCTYQRVTFNKGLLFTVFLQYFVAGLLCIVAIDFSRWVFFAGITSTIMVFSFANKHNKNYQNLKLIIFIYYFFIGFQHIGWSFDKHMHSLPIKLLENPILKIDKF